MADEPKPKKESQYKANGMYDYVLGNTQKDPRDYYNIAAYVVLYNKIKGNMFNEFKGDSTVFDSQINQKIRDGLSGTPAEVREFLSKMGLDDLIKVYDPPISGKDARKNEYDYQLSSDFMKDKHNFDLIVSEARMLSANQYGKTESGGIKQMLSYEDAEVLLKIKEEKSDKNHFRKYNDLVSNLGLFDADGKMTGGKVGQALFKANTYMKGLAKNRRFATLKVLAWGGLSIAAGFLTGGVGFAALGLGGQAMAGALGSLYTVTKAAGTLVSLAATVFLGGITSIFFKKAVTNFGERRKKAKDRFLFKHSLGKYAEAGPDEWDKMGYKRVKERFNQFAALKKAYENYQAGKPVVKRYKGFGKNRKEIPFSEYKLEDFVPRKLLKGYYAFVREQKELFGDAGLERGETGLLKNAQHHMLVNGKKFKPGQFRFENIHKAIGTPIMSQEVSGLSSDEVKDYYGTGVDSKTETKGLLHKDRIVNAPGGELNYISGTLDQYKGEKKKFDDAHRESDYREGLMKFANAYRDSFESVLFEKPYSKNEFDDANKHATKTANAFLEETAPAIGAKVNSMVSFIDSVLKETRECPPISGDVGVAVQYQIDFSEDSLLKGCETFGDVPEAVKNAAKELAKMDRESRAGRVKTRIEALANGPAKDYLMHMYNSKKLSVRLDTVSEFTTDRKVGTTDSIAALINDMKRVSDVDDIKRKISIQISDASQKDAALKALENQAKRLATKTKDEARLNASHAVRSGVDNYTDILKEINEFADLNYDKASSLKSKINKITPSDCRDYLMSRFKDKIYKTMTDYAGNKDNFNKEGFTSLRNFLSDIFAFSDKGLVDAWQRDTLLNVMNKERIVPAFDTFLKDVELGFFTDAQKENVAQVGKFITTTLSSGTGFKEYLEMNTPDSNKVRDRLQRIYDATYGLRDRVSSSKVFEDPDSPELKAFLKTYFEKDRPVNNDLVKMLTKFNDISGKLIDKDNLEVITADNDTVDAFDGSGTKMISDLNKSFIYSIAEELKKFDATDGKFKGSIDGVNKTLDEKDSMAALIIIKRRTLAKMKEHIAMLRQNHSGDFTHWLTTPESSTYINNMKKQWLKIATMIDDKIYKLRDSNTFDPSYVASNNTANIVNAQFTSTTSVLEFVDSKGLGMS